MRAVAKFSSTAQRSFARRSRTAAQIPLINQLQSFAPEFGLRFSSSRANDKKPWLDKKVSNQARVDQFSKLELGQLGGRSISSHSVELADQCCRYRGSEGMKLAHAILDRVIAEKQYLDSNRSSSGQPPVKIPIMLFQKILYGWAQLSSKEAMTQMRNIMDLVIQISKEDQKMFPAESEVIGDESLLLQPNTGLYNTYLIGLRNSAENWPEAATMAKDVLDEMIGMHQQYGWHTKPNTRSYTYAIKAFANSKMKDAGPEAEKVLRRMKLAHKEEKAAYLSEVGTPYNTENPHDNKRRIVTADEVAYSYVMQAYAQDPSLKAATKARDLLVEIMRTNDGTVKANFALVTSVIASFARLAENPRVSKETRLKAAQDAEEVLDMVSVDGQLLEESKQTRNNGDLLDPYNACMNAYAGCGVPDAALRAETILYRLLSNFTDGKSDVHPDTISFNTVLKAWASSKLYDSPKKAEELMRLQIQLVDSGVLPSSAKPDVRTFVILMTAYSRSKAADKVVQTYRLVQELIQSILDGDIVPDSGLVIAFTAVLDAAAYKAPARRKNKKSSEQKEDQTPLPGFESPDHEAFNNEYATALQAYRELKDDIYQLGCKPDHFVFAKMIEVVGTHTDRSSTERRNMLQLIFEDACAAGEVSKLVLKYLLQVCPDKTILASLLQSEELANEDIETVDVLPSDWTSNVPRTFRHIRVPVSERKFKR